MPFDRIFLNLLSLLSMILFGIGIRGDTPWRTESWEGTWDPAERLERQCAQISLELRDMSWVGPQCGP